MIFFVNANTKIFKKSFFKRRKLEFLLWDEGRETISQPEGM